MKNRNVVRLGIILVLVFCVLFPVQAQPGMLEGFDDYVTRALQDWDVPGAAVVIVKDDSVVLCKGYGVRHVAETAPVDENTLFGIASCSKAFTAASLAMLVDEGKITWDDPVIKHLPWFQLYDPWVTREITIRDLLTHRCGLPEYGGDLMWWGSTRSREEILRRVRFVRPTSSFRSRYAYHNIMFVAAGQIIPAVTGKSWEDFVAERILLPLGMKSSTTSTAALKGSTALVTPHMRINGVLQPVAWRNVDNGGPAGAITSNVKDLAQWIRLQLGRGTHKGGSLFSLQASRSMWSPQMVMPSGAPSATDPEPAPQFRAYGLGWGTYDYRGRKILRHFGETDGMSSVVALIPEEHLGLAILTNMHVTTMHKALMYRIFDLYLGPPIGDWSTEFLGAERKSAEIDMKKRKEIEAARVTGTHPSLPLRSYSGTYENEVYGTATVEEKEGKLVVRLNTTPSAIGDLQHWHFDTFEATWRDPVFDKGFMVFTLGAEGTVVHMSLRVSDFIEPSEYIFERVIHTR